MTSLIELVRKELSCLKVGAKSGAITPSKIGSMKRKGETRRLVQALLAPPSVFELASRRFDRLIVKIFFFVVKKRIGRTTGAFYAKMRTLNARKR